ncbi:2-phospho-L-lactate guanylyltransferase, partial [Microbacterium arthrosphaerae]
MSPLFGRRRQNSTDSSAGHPESPAVGADAAASVELRRPRWVVVIPVKRSTQGKSRLDVPGAERAELARAIALDTIEAAARCELVLQVVVVSDDPALAREAAMIPALRFVPEGEPRGLDAAVATGMTAIDPAGRMPRAALLGDLPALRPADLADALRVAA